jgi:hypothetical protein
LVGSSSAKKMEFTTIKMIDMSSKMGLVMILLAIKFTHLVNVTLHVEVPELHSEAQKRVRVSVDSELFEVIHFSDP